MALQGDGNGIVTIPKFQSFGVFSVTGKAIYKSATQIILGFNGASSIFIACFSGGTVKASFGGLTLERSGFSDGDVLGYTWSRDANNLVTFNVNGSSITGTNSSAISIDTIGAYNGGSLKYTGQWQDDLVITGDGTTTNRSYSFNQPNGSLLLPDSTSGEGGTLSGFTSGGFVGSGNEIVITSVSDFDSKTWDINEQAVFTIAGTLAGDTVVEYELDGNGVWATLDGAATTTFTGDILITKQQSVVVRLANDITTTAAVYNLTAGLSIAAWWQSNMQGYLTNHQLLTVTGNNPIPVMYKGGVFQQLADPTSTVNTGSILPLLAQKYTDLGIPVIFANVAVGGTSIIHWEKGTANYTNIATFANAVGGNLNHTLSIGGESDTINGTSQANIESRLGGVVSDLNADFGSTHYLVDFPIGDALGGDPSVARLAFDSVISASEFCDFAGDLSVIDIDTTANAENDGIHIKTDADAVTTANIIYNALTSVVSTLTLTATGYPDGTYSAEFYQATSPLIHIKTENVTFSSGTSSLTIPIAASTTIYTRIDGSTPPSTGVTCYGVTV